ncbi:CrcB family protein [Pseudomonas mosselii]|nr:CrcB family protein [Pseudomonas mosselii]MDH1100683.1 CrcB family protein [Pseudomonas mosselii]MDN4499826.1 CrcB family protein [Pseudomonas mosselii]UVN42578.1 CrcB family protein [Pseudomonas mosselii]
MAFFLRLPNLDPAWRLLITTGFCGGLTTFSTFCAEVLSMLMHGRAGWAMATAHL